MATDQDLEILISANAEGVKAGMDAASNAVSKGMGDMVAHLNSATESSKNLVDIIQLKLVAAFTALSTTIMTSVSASAKYIQEAEDLSRKLGESATNASTLMQALDNTYVSTDEYTGAAKGLEKQLKNNEAGLNAMGLATRDSAGHLRPLQDLMMDGIGIVNEYRAGTDRNVAATQIFGKAIVDGSRLLELNKQALIDAREANEQLGLVVGVESVKNFDAYRAAQKDVSDAMEGLKNIIGQEFMPVFTDLMVWFRDIAPDAIFALKTAFGALAIAVNAAYSAFYALWQIIAGTFDSVMVSLVTGFSILDRVIHLDFAGAKREWQAGMDALGGIVQERMEKIISQVEKTNANIAQILSGEKQTDQPAPDGSGKSAPTKSAKEKETSMAAIWKEQLEEVKMLQGHYSKDYRQEDLKFWEEKLALTHKGGKDWLVVMREIYNLKKSIALDAEKEEQARLKKEFKELEEHHKEMLKESEKLAKEQKELDLEAIGHKKDMDLADLQRERDLIANKKELGQIDAVQELEALQDLEDRKYQIELAALADASELMDKESLEYQKMLDKIELMQKQHEIKMDQMRQATVAAQAKEYEDMLKPVTSAIEKSVAGMIQGTLSWQKALHNIFQAILGEFVSMLSKKLVAWVTNEAAQTTATATGASARTAIEQTASSQSILSGAMAAIKNIMNSAYETFAAIYKAIAGIPFVGPFMAPAMAAAGMAVVVGVAGSVMSASGGFDIPSGTNPLTQLHEEEMVLPKDIANPLRDQISGGGSGGNYTINITAMDARSVRDYFKANSHILAPALKNLGRNFGDVR